MLKKEMEKALNEQINKESAMLKGAANWMHVQAQEEGEHAMRIYTYINDRGGRVELAPIKGPATVWDSPLKAFEEALKHEIYISESIDAIMALANESKDYMTASFLQWFVSEQVEEEANARDNVDKFTLVNSNPNGIYMIDRELAQRVFVSGLAAK